MRENCTSGSVEGASGNGRSYSVSQTGLYKPYDTVIVFAYSTHEFLQRIQPTSHYSLHPAVQKSHASPGSIVIPEGFEFIFEFPCSVNASIPSFKCI